MEKMTKKRFFDKTIENLIRYLVEKTNNHTLEKILNRIISNTSYDDNVVLCKFLFEIIEGVKVTKKTDFKTKFCRCVNTLTEIMKAWGNIDNKNNSIRTPSLSGGGGGKRIIILLIILALLYFLYTSVSFVEQDVGAIVDTVHVRRDVVAKEARILSNIFQEVVGPHAVERFVQLFNEHFVKQPEVPSSPSSSLLAIEDGVTNIALPPPRPVGETGETKEIALPSQGRPVITLPSQSQDIVPFRGIEGLKKNITLINPAEIPALVRSHFQQNIDFFISDVSILLADILKEKSLKCSEEFRERTPDSNFELLKRAIVETVTGDLVGEGTRLANRLKDSLEDCISRNKDDLDSLNTQLRKLARVSERETTGLVKDVHAIVQKTARGGRSIYYGISIASTLIYFIYNMRYLNN